MEVKQQRNYKFPLGINSTLHSKKKKKHQKKKNNPEREWTRRAIQLDKLQAWEKLQRGKKSALRSEAV